LLASEYKEIGFIGVDKTHGRFGEVSALQCRRCERYWIRYFVEYEHLSGSGRWYMGVIAPTEIENITPVNAVEYLESLDWHHFGGSYFGFSGRSPRKKLWLD
jgi:hypothetical protein